MSANPIRFSVNGVTDASGNATLTVDPRSLPNYAQIWNAYINVTGQLSIIECMIGEQLIAAANGTSPALGPVYTLPYEQVQFVVTQATPNTFVSVTVTGYEANDANDLPAIAAPPQNLQGPIVGSADTIRLTLLNLVDTGINFSQRINMAGYGGFFLQIETVSGFPAGPVQFHVQYYDRSNTFIAEKSYELDNHVTKVIDTLPMFGDNIVISTANGSGATIGQIRYTITPMQFMPPKSWADEYTLFITFGGQSVGAGNTVETFAGYVTTGPTVLTFYTQIQTYDAQIRYYDNGNAVILWRSTNANIVNGLALPINIPGHPISLRYVNNAGAANTPAFNLTVGE